MMKASPTDFRRTTMIVNDIERSLYIYQDILGMTVYYDKELIVSGRGLPTGVYDAQTRLVILKCNHAYVGMLGLLQYLDPPLPPSPPRPIPNRVMQGESVLVMNTDDVEHVHTRLLSIEGVDIVSKPHLQEYPKPDGGMFRILGMSFFDPNGYFIELNQFLSAPHLNEDDH